MTTVLADGDRVEIYRPLKADPKEIRRKRAAEGKLKWTGTQYPTQASAQDAEMSLAEYEDFVFTAGLLHEQDPIAAWKGFSEEQQRFVDFLNTKKDICYELGLIAEELGDAAKAAGYYKQIYQVDIGYKDVAERVERIYGSQ